MKEILGEAKTVRELLGNARYDVDYYQREYRWGTKQVQELLEDLAEKFLDDFEPSHGPEAVEGYGHYFLGSVVISRKETKSFIVDGQQRLTTLTLLLIYLYNALRERGDDEDAATVRSLIFSKKHGRRSFNLDVEDRTPCMEALFKGETFDADGQPESVRNLVARYGDISERFPEELPEEEIGDKLPYFVDWLIENVHMVEITAYSDEDAYAVFETMNDRGLSLTPTEMLRGYLLANITDETKRKAASNVWNDRMAELAELGKEENADFFKSWLRSQYARKIRERKKGATPEDFDLIGSEYHRWVGNNRDLLNLHTSADFDRLIGRDLSFFARQYRRLRLAAWNYTPELADVYHNAQLGFTLQYPVLLASLAPDDAGGTDSDRKLRIVGVYLDILLACRLWNFRSIAYNTMQYRMFLDMRDIRGKSPEDLATMLRSRLDAEHETFSGYVVHSLEAALWAFHNSDSFEQGALLAVNLGDDADTTGAVYGQLAGAYYGEKGIPKSWRRRLAHRLLVVEYFAEWLFRLGKTVDWDRLLTYLPIFERPGFEFAREVRSSGFTITSPDGSTEPIPYYEWSPEVEEFHKALYEVGVVIVFDWSAWRKEAERLFNDPEALAHADEVTLRKLLTFHSRKERFVEGHFTEMLKSGHITAILRRARELEHIRKCW